MCLLFVAINQENRWGLPKMKTHKSKYSCSSLSFDIFTSLHYTLYPLKQTERKYPTFPELEIEPNSPDCISTDRISTLPPSKLKYI